MSLPNRTNFPAREGLEGNEAGGDAPGKHAHPAGNPIESRPYLLLRVPAGLFRLVLWLTVVSCLLDLAGNFISSVKTVAMWVAMMNAISWLWIVMVTDMRPGGEFQTLSADEEGEA
jgi:hypothetical protein